MHGSCKCDRDLINEAIDEHVARQSRRYLKDILIINPPAIPGDGNVFQEKVSNDKG